MTVKLKKAPAPAANSKAAGPGPVQAKVATLAKELNASLIDREDEVYLTLTALVGQTTLLLVGPPGCAKSFTLRALFKQGTDMPGRYFEWPLSRFTEPAELFGGIDLAALKGGVQKVNTKGKLPEAVVAFLDEVFKGSTAILGTLLRITNERVFDDGTGEKRVPLRSLVAGSNEFPQDGEVNAFYDRFVLRKNVGYVRSKASRRKLRAKMDHTPVLTVRLTEADLDTAYAEAMALPVSAEVGKAADEIVESCIEQGCHPSDRREPLIPRIVRAWAYVQGAKEVRVEHLEVLRHMLWDDPIEGEKKVRQIVQKVANPVGMRATDLLEEIEDVAARFCDPARHGDRPVTLTDTEAKLGRIKDDLAVMPPDHPRVAAAREAWEDARRRVDLRAYNLQTGGV